MAGRWVPEYLRRVWNYGQMDLEYTAWQMFYLCLSPSRVYRTTSWHKQTKNQWARDDPAFVAILSYFIFMATLAYAVTFQLSGGAVVKLLLWSIGIDFLTIGLVVATTGWWISNRYLRVAGGSVHSHSVEQSVEWLYAFDVHCNSFFPAYLLLHVVQFFLLPLVLRQPGFLYTLLANSLYLVAVVYYCHITFLGYNALPFLQNTVCFLYPVGFFVVVYIISLIVNFNVAIFALSVYFGSFLP